MKHYIDNHKCYVYDLNDLNDSVIVAVSWVIVIVPRCGFHKFDLVPV